MFKLAQVVGDGSPIQLLDLSDVIEGTIHSAIVNNTTGLDQTITFIVGATTISYPVPNQVSTKIEMTINIPAGKLVQVTAPTGVTVTASYVEMAVDAASALSTAQQITTDTIDQTEAFLATLPEGSINDSTVSTVNTWSSNQQAQKGIIGAPDWAVNLTYDVSDNLTEALYVKGTDQFKQTLNYNGAGDLDTVVYEQSNDSGVTWITLGTETLVYSNGTLVSTNWSEA